MSEYYMSYFAEWFLDIKICKKVHVNVRPDGFSYKDITIRKYQPLSYVMKNTLSESILC
jgi:hypothetical protein